MRKGEKGDYRRKGFKASEIYYAMTAEIPEIHSYKHKWENGIPVPDLTKPIYAIDRMDEFQQEFILDGLRGRYEERIEKLNEFHAKTKREGDERYQNFMAYMRLKQQS